MQFAVLSIGVLVQAILAIGTGIGIHVIEQAQSAIDLPTRPCAMLGTDKASGGHRSLARLVNCTRSPLPGMRHAWAVSGNTLS